MSLTKEELMAAAARAETYPINNAGCWAAYRDDWNDSSVCYFLSSPAHRALG